MKKVELIQQVAQESGQSPSTVRLVLDATCAVVHRAMGRHEAIHLFGLGKLFSVNRPERSARNLHTGALMMVPAHRTARYSPSASIVKAING